MTLNTINVVVQRTSYEISWKCDCIAKVTNKKRLEMNLIMVFVARIRGSMHNESIQYVEKVNIMPMNVQQIMKISNTFS